MSIVNKPNTFSNGQTADGTQVNANFDTLYNDYNGNISEANMANSFALTTYGKVNGSAISNLAGVAVAAGAIPEVNLPTIATAGKVNGASLTGLASIPAGAGVVPAANLPAVTPQVGFGSWVDKSASYGAQQAATDGFVIITTSGGGDRQHYGYTDANSNPTTIRAAFSTYPDGSEQLSAMFPVKKNDYWKVVVSGGSGSLVVWWIPLGS